MSAPITFGELLRHYRTTRALSQESLAARSGLSTRGISDLERGARTTPHLETVRMLADALELEEPDRTALLAAARPRQQALSEDRPSFNLPVPLTPLIGRESETSNVVRLITDSSIRLVTLTGPGGVGKTRLAIESATRAASAFPAGVFFVELAPVSNPELVISAISEVLGVQESAAASLSLAIERFLSDKQLLLVLDNFEHLLRASSNVARILVTCPGPTILTTSRIALRVRGERQWPVAPLSVPKADRSVSREEIEHAPAVRVFVARAQEANPTFAVTEDNASTIVEICRRLDGLPLALELAAARSSVLPPAAVLSRLERRLPLLTDGSPDLPERHQTLKGTIAWSYALLSRSEQTLFRRLAVFAGGWTLEAAEKVAAGDGDIDVFSGLVALATASLVQSVPQPDGDARFGMLETIREFADQQLAASGEADEVNRLHAEYYLTVAQAAAADLADVGPGGWLTRMETEQANLRAALVWLRNCGSAGPGLAMAAALGGFWRLRNALTEGRGWLETFLAQDPSVTSLTDRIAALRWAGELAGLEGDAATAMAHLAESLALARKLRDKEGISAALGAIASALFQGGDSKGSSEHFEEAIALARETGNKRQLAFLLAYYAYALGLHGELGRAISLVTESQSLVRSLGDRRSFEASLASMVRGWLAVMTEDFDQAADWLQEAYKISSELNSKATLSVTLSGLGEVSLARGEPERATGFFSEGLQVGRDGGYPPGVAFNLEGLVRVASLHGEFIWAARALGVLDSMGEALYAMHPAVVRAYEAAMATVRSALGIERFTAEQSAGRSNSLEDIISDGPSFVRVH